MAVKGKEIAGKASTSSSKGKKISTKTTVKKTITGSSNDRKRKRSGVLQFFDVTADVGDDEEDRSDNDNLFAVQADMMDVGDVGGKGKGVFGKAPQIPVIPKEEELSDDEIEKLIRERYKSGSKHVRYAEEDDYEAKHNK